MAAGLLFVACAREADRNALANGGIGDDSTDADVYIEASAESMQEAEQDEMSVDAATATCIATVTLELVGVDALVAAHITPEEFAEAENFAELDVELPEDAMTELADGLADCDIAEPLAEATVEALVVGMGEELSPEATSCLEEALESEALVEALAESFIDGSKLALTMLLSDAFASCPEVVTEVFVAQVPGPVTPEDEACVQAVIEAHPEMVRSMVERDADGQELRALIVGECPGIVG